MDDIHVMLTRQGRSTAATQQFNLVYNK